MANDTVTINRAPVLTLWAAVVAERLGYDEDTALSFGKCLAGLNAQSKGRSLGLFGTPKAPEQGGPPKKHGLGEEFWVAICGRPLPAKNTPAGVRAVIKDKPIDPRGVRDYLDRAFGPDLQKVRGAFAGLATSFTPEELSEQAYGLYERFRPAVQRGQAGWGQKGLLDLDLVKSLAKKDRA